MPHFNPKHLALWAALAGMLVWTTPGRADDKSENSARKPAASGSGTSTSSGTGTSTNTGTVATATAGGLGPAGEGRRLYLKLNCYSCHGMAAAGGMGPNIVRADLGDLSEAVYKGEEKGMRAYTGYVSATDLNNLLAYLGSIGTASEPKFRDWWVPVPTK